MIEDGACHTHAGRSPRLSGRRDLTHTDVVLDEPGPSEIGVRTRCSGISIGTELNLLRGAVSWGPYPICTDYQAVGVVEAVGEEVTDFAVGDRVYYRDNQQLRLPDGTEVSPTEGTHCSRALIEPETAHGVAHLPEGVEEGAASLFVMPAVGLNGVTMAEVGFRDTVVVHGTGLIGLGVVAACHHRGAEVIAVDLQSSRLEVAERLGAEHLVDASGQDVERAVEELAPDGADVVFEATGIPDCVDVALPLCRDRGTFVFQGDYGEGQLPFEFRVPTTSNSPPSSPATTARRPAAGRCSTTWPRARSRGRRRSPTGSTPARRRRSTTASTPPTRTTSSAR